MSEHQDDVFEYLTQSSKRQWNIEDLPPGSFLWLDRLIENVDLCWPWPYTLCEIENIKLRFSDEKEHWIEQLVKIARSFLAKEWAIAADKSKPNPLREATKLWHAAEKFEILINAVSIEGHDFLSKHNRFDDFEMSSMALKVAIGRFRHAHKTLASIVDPEIDFRGRPPNQNYHAFAELLRSLYHQAGGNRTRGFPTFRQAVVEPLQYLGIRSLSPKAWQEVEANRKAGENKQK